MMEAFEKAGKAMASFVSSASDDKPQSLCSLQEKQRQPTGVGKRRHNEAERTLHRKQDGTSVSNQQKKRKNAESESPRPAEVSQKQAPPLNTRRMITEVPQGKQPGDTFQVKLPSGNLVTVQCPVSAKAGDKITFTVQAESQASVSVSAQQQQQPQQQPQQHTIVLNRVKACRKGAERLMDHLEQVAMDVCEMGSARLKLGKALAIITNAETNGNLVKRVSNDPDCVRRHLDEQLLPAMQKAREACKTAIQKKEETARELNQLRHQIRVQQGNMAGLASTNQQQARDMSMVRAELNQSSEVSGENVTSCFPIVAEVVQQYKTFCADPLSELVLEQFVEVQGVDNMKDLGRAMHHFVDFCDYFVSSVLSKALKRIYLALGKRVQDSEMRPNHLDASMRRMLQGNFRTLLPLRTQEGLEKSILYLLNFGDGTANENMKSKQIWADALKHNKGQAMVHSCLRDMCNVMLLVQLSQPSLELHICDVGGETAYNQYCKTLDDKCKPGEACMPLVPALCSGERKESPDYELKAPMMVLPLEYL
jgi:hypothetical protein